MSQLYLAKLVFSICNAPNKICANPHRNHFRSNFSPLRGSYYTIRILDGIKEAMENDPTKIECDSFIYRPNMLINGFQALK